MGLVLGLLLSPILGGLVLHSADRLARGRRSRSELEGSGWGAAIVALGIATICAFGLLFVGEQELQLGSWLPGTGAMSLHTGGVGGYAAFAVTLTAFIVFVTERRGKPTAASASMMALSGAVVAFTADHFLLRYVALEAVALCAAAIPLIERPGHDGGRRARFVYVLLRVGDAGLLTAILILMTASGTLEITAALSAGADLDRSQLAWVVVGMALAIWVKAGVWPLGVWKRAGYGMVPVTGFWLYDLLVPSLGLYLLYRVTPMIALDPTLRWSILGAAIVSVLVGGWRLARRWQGAPTVWAGSVVNGIALCCAAFGASGAVALLLLASTAMQLALGLWAGRSPDFAAKVRILTSALPGADIEPWLLRRLDELRSLAEGGVFDAGGLRLWHGLEGGAGLVYRLVEQQGMEWLLRGASRGAIAGGRAMQRWHTGRLRANLGWTVAVLLLVITLLAAKGW